jgi:lysophospholipid acyltransferase (LPLAT)-like uncharacterized protein
MIKIIRYYFRRRIKPFFIAHSAKAVLRAILWTCRCEVEGVEQFQQVASKQKCILMLWHNRLALVAEVMYKHAPQFIYTAVISNSRDGEPLAILANSYKIGRSIRVPHNSRHQALRKMINHLKQYKEVVIVTPDGPRGPRYEMKPGIVVAAKETAAAIIPFSWSANRFWQLKTWDKLILPKPFSTIKVTLGPPIDLLTQDSQNDLSFLENTLKSIDHKTYTSITLNPNQWPQ